jgi:hypothetical protein
LELDVAIALRWQQKGEWKINGEGEIRRQDSETFPSSTLIAIEQPKKEGAVVPYLLIDSCLCLFLILLLFLYEKGDLFWVLRQVEE